MTLWLAVWAVASTGAAVWFSGRLLNTRNDLWWERIKRRDLERRIDELDVEAARLRHPSHRDLP